MRDAIVYLGDRVFKSTPPHPYPDRAWAPRAWRAAGCDSPYISSGLQHPPDRGHLEYGVLPSVTVPTLARVCSTLLTVGTSSMHPPDRGHLEHGVLPSVTVPTISTYLQYPPEIRRSFPSAKFRTSIPIDMIKLSETVHKSYSRVLQPITQERASKEQSSSKIRRA
ncbi:hypothetical protein J6590_084227 [Homalodisca vitripennis]|nr:hypothetical protein J6590_084227 [Homalodisca vitripennis]